MKKTVDRKLIYFAALWIAVAFTPLVAQEETDPFEEEFGEEFLDEEGFLEEEDFPLEGDEFGDEEFFDEEGFDEEGFDEEGLAGFDDLEAAPFQEDFEGDTRQGYTITVSGGMPTFRNSTLLPWLGAREVRRHRLFWRHYDSIGAGKPSPRHGNAGNFSRLHGRTKHRYGPGGSVRLETWHPCHRRLQRA